VAAPAPGDTLFTRYRRVIAEYDPAPYPGRLAVLRSETMKDLRPSLGWSAIGKEVELHAIPGDHFTSITRNIATTAARLRACLDSALGPRSRDADGPQSSDADGIRTQA
jgi:hypothetical protein